LDKTDLIIYSQTNLAAVNIPSIEFPSKWIIFTSISVDSEVGMIEETCLIAVAECLRIFEEFDTQGNRWKP
jgi:hypothetical protein